VTDKKLCQKAEGGIDIGFWLGTNMVANPPGGGASALAIYSSLISDSISGRERGVRFLAFGLVLVMGLAVVRAEERTTAEPTRAEVAAWRKRLLEMRKAFEVLPKEDREGAWERGRREVAAIDDPAAVPAIVALLETEKHGQFRRALIQPLLSIGGKEALTCLVKWSVEDTLNPYLRQEACHGLAEKPELPEYLDQYLAYLKPVRQGRNMRFPTEAAEALRMTGLAAPLQDGQKPNEQMVRLLTGALESAHVWVKQTDATLIKGLIPDPRDSEARQKRKTPLAGKLPKVETPNPVVLLTLQEYTGQDFQYDKAAWLAWLDDKLKE
jgi:hypothetical protein